MEEIHMVRSPKSLAAGIIDLREPPEARIQPVRTAEADRGIYGKTMPMSCRDQGAKDITHHGSEG